MTIPDKSSSNKPSPVHYKIDHKLYLTSKKKKNLQLLKALKTPAKFLTLQKTTTKKTEKRKKEIGNKYNNINNNSNSNCLINNPLCNQLNKN